MDDTSDISDDGGVMDTVSEIGYPVLRLLLAGLTVWYSSGASA
jgi:hypothetical protein